MMLDMFPQLVWCMWNVLIDSEKMDCDLKSEIQ